MRRIFERIESITRWMDRLALTQVSVAGHARPAFQVCGCAGLIAAVALSLILVSASGLSYLVMGVIVFAAVATFLALVFATKIVTGEERIIYYHHEIAVMLAAGFVARMMRSPVLPYLDVTILGIGAFLACGRVGCLMVGCCHGRPAPWGIRYDEEHVSEGFAPYLVGVRLFPVQAIEAIWVLLVALTGGLLILRGAAPGTALAWYTITYGTARFVLEFGRGGADRPHRWAFSEAQWLSVALILVAIGSEISGLLPFAAWHVVVVAVMVLGAFAIALHRQLDPARTFQMWHPQHVREIASALRNQGTGIVVSATSAGIQISAGEIVAADGVLRHYSFSLRNGSLEHETAAVLADLVMRLRHSSTTPELVRGNGGVFHLLVRETAQEELAPQ